MRQNITRAPNRRIKTQNTLWNMTVRMHMQTGRISSFLRQCQWRRYVLCAVGGCSKLEAQQRRTHGRWVSSDYVSQWWTAILLTSVQLCCLALASLILDETNVVFLKVDYRPSMLIMVLIAGERRISAGRPSRSRWCSCCQTSVLRVHCWFAS